MIRRLSDRFWNYLTDRIEARMDLRPDRDDTLDLGSSDYQWRRVYVGPGSVSAPAVTLDGDTNTGIYQSAADNLDFATGGAKRLNISSTGLTVAGRVLGSTGIGAVVYRNEDTTIPHNTWTSISFNTELYDSDGIHSLAINTGRLTCQTAGLYIITGTARFESNATGIRGLDIYLNGTTRIGLQFLPLAGDIRFDVTAVQYLNKNNYVELRAYQTSGDNLDVIYESLYSPRFSMVRIA